MADPKIRYDIEAGIKGEADVEQLARTVRTLGESLDGDLKQQANAAADALDNLGAKKAAVESFTALRREAAQLSTELDQATASVDRLGDELPQATTAAANFAAAEAKQRAALAEITGELKQQREALKTLRSETDTAGRSSDEFKQKQAALASNVRELASRQKEYAAEVRTAATATKQAETSERALAGEYQKSITSAQRLSAEIRTKNGAVEASRSALQSYGIQTTNLVGVERQLSAALGQVRAQVLELAPAFQRVQSASSAASQRQAADARTVQSSLQGVQRQLQTIQTIASAAVGGAFLTGMIRDVAKTADEFKNLQARIQLATGESGDFAKQFADVAAVALATHSPLEETGTLFARIAKAGTEAGLSARAAAEQSLGLTTSINQAVQLSGSGADASKAAITQLIQGLQSGVLRGEEFNSVMEQAPRLAQALANGLNRTTGELRGMAEQGALTTNVVIQALTSQSAALEKEFQKLPLTVGRSLQDLSTQWSLYVGAADNGFASSANLAKIIQALSGNLDTLVSTLYAAGKAYAAIKIAGLAMDAYKWAAATLATTSAVTANTTAVAVNTVAHGANAAALRASAASASAQAAAVVANTSRIGAAGAVLGRFGVLLGPVGIGLAAVAPEIIGLGQALGEGIAKWQGYGKVIQDAEDKLRLQDEASKAATASQRLMAAQLQATRDAQFGLTRQAGELVASFDDLVKKGNSASEAIESIGKKFDLSTLPGFRTAAGVLDKLQTDAKITATQFEAAFASALKTEDLQNFEVRARAAFSGGAREAERLAAVLNATTREAIRRTGLDFDQISGGMSKATVSAINDSQTIIDNLARLKAQGVDTGQALAVSISKGIDTADGKKALEVLQSQIESVRKVLGDKVTDGLLDQAKKKAEELADKLAGAVPGIQTVAEAMKALGVTSDKSLKDTAKAAKEAYDFLSQSGTASTRELGEAFQKYATDAIAANKGIADSTIKAQAAQRGFAITTDESGKSVVSALKAATGSVEDLAGSFVNLGDASKLASDQAVDGLEKQVTAAEKVIEVNERAAALERKRQGVDKSGFAADSSGNRIVAGSDLGSLTGIAAFLKNAGVSDDAQARSIASEFADSRGNITYMGNPGQKKYGGDTLSVALLRAAERVTFGIGGSGLPAPGSTIPKAPETRVVNVQLQVNGTSYGQIATDAVGANALTNFLGQLQTAKGVSK